MGNNSVAAAQHCHLCHAAQLEAIPIPDPDVAAISSDGRLVEGKLAFAVCKQCNTLQKRIDANWQKNIEHIYRHYEINYQSGGAEPYIFGSLLGTGPRAELLVKHIKQQLPLGQHGTLLDIGCGNGNILRSFHQSFPDWELYGLENSDKWEKDIRRLPGVQDFFTDVAALKNRRFDMIVLSHVLEHIPQPKEYLEMLKQHLTPGGRIFIAVPNIRKNPIDLFVLDHCTHFDDVTIYHLFQQAGFHTVGLETVALKREILAIISTDSPDEISPPKPYAQPVREMCAAFFAIAFEMLDLAKQLRQRRPLFGVMGSSTAAIWLSGQLPTMVDFFLDEDTHRIGNTLLGKPIYALADIPQTAATIFIPMNQAIARDIISRAPKQKKFNSNIWQIGIKRASRGFYLPNALNHCSTSA